MANNQLIASDNFASGSLAAGWAIISGSLNQITGTPFVAEPPSTSATGRQKWTGLAWPNDHISEITLASMVSEAATQLELWVRVQSGTYSGYLANIVNGSVSLYRLDSGVATQLGLTNGVTIAAGDIWTFSATGANIVLYQNYKEVHRGKDATYTSGSPGFGCNSSAAVANVKVGAWRGYNTIQQDGVWNKQGVIFPAVSGDLPLGDQNCCIIPDTNAQILSGTVYKMWFTANQALAYAESLDGIHWTRSVSYPALTNAAFCPSVIKVGSTYHLYGQPVGVYNINHYTSTDGVNWTGGTQVFTLGTAGQWDDGFVYYFTPVYIDIGGTWYAYYTAGHLSGGVATGALSTGLATSPDGLTWTRHVGNPIISNFWGIIKVTKVGSTFYTWAQTNNPGQGSGQPFVDPGEAARMQSTDLINWTNRVHSAHHSQMFENVSGVKGGYYPSFVMDIGGKAFQYASVSNDDADGGGFFQLTLAIAPVPIAQLVTANEDAAAPVASDAFTSGAGSLSANWTTPTGGTALQIVPGPYVESTAVGPVCSAVFTGASFGPSQYSEITLQTLAGTLGTARVLPTVRASTAAVTAYEAEILSPSGTSDAAAFIAKSVAGAITQIGPTVVITPNVGDVFRLQVITGSDGFPTLSLFQNGFLIVQVQDQSATPITSGNPGFAIFNSSAIANVQISSWAGGNANVIPTYPPLPVIGGSVADGPMISALFPVLMARMRIAAAYRNRKK
jgi:hypothetical protein